jgi:hypothetical protein
MVIFIVEAAVRRSKIMSTGRLEDSAGGLLEIGWEGMFKVLEGRFLAPEKAFCCNV